MIVSMTGFGKGEAHFEQKKIVVEIRTLNSKNIDLNFRTPHSYRELEGDLRKIVNRELIRGKIDISIFVDNAEAESATMLNKTVIKSYIQQLEAIHKGESTELLKIAVRLPDALKTEKEALEEGEKNTVHQLFSDTLAKVIHYRKNEGEALEKDFLLRLSNLKSLLENVKMIDPERKERISEKLGTALDKLKIEIDQNRFEQELIYYLEKYDITEEKVRLANHISYFTEIMNQPLSNGKKLGFIAQEMGREINTIGSKANHSELQKIVVQMKDELEKIKEQLLNVL